MTKKKDCGELNSLAPHILKGHSVSLLEPWSIRHMNRETMSQLKGRPPQKARAEGANLNSPMERQEVLRPQREWDETLGPFSDDLCDTVWRATLVGGCWHTQQQLH